jgi:hypothetical protein
MCDCRAMLTTLSFLAPRGPRISTSSEIAEELAVDMRARIDATPPVLPRID